MMICPFRKLGCNGQHRGEKTDFHIILLLRKVLDLEQKLVDVDFLKLPKVTVQDRSDDDCEPTCDQGTDKPSHDTLLPLEDGLIRAAASPYMSDPRMGTVTSDPHGALIRSSLPNSVRRLAQDSGSGSVESASCVSSITPPVIDAGSLLQRRRQQHQIQEQPQKQQSLREEEQARKQIQRKQSQGRKCASARTPCPVSTRGRKPRRASTPTVTIVSLDAPVPPNGMKAFPMPWSRWKTHPPITASIPTIPIPPRASEQTLSASQQRMNRLIRRQNKKMLRKNARQFRITPHRGRKTKKVPVTSDLSTVEKSSNCDDNRAMVVLTRQALNPFGIPTRNSAKMAAADSAFEGSNSVDSAHTSVSTNASTERATNVSSSECSTNVETSSQSSWAAVVIGKTPQQMQAHFEKQSPSIVTQFTSCNTAAANAASLSHWKGVQMPYGDTIHTLANDARHISRRTDNSHSSPATIFAPTPSASSRESIVRRNVVALGCEENPCSFTPKEDGAVAEASLLQRSSPSCGSESATTASESDIGAKIGQHQQNVRTTQPASTGNKSVPIAGWRESGGDESDRSGNDRESRTMEIDSRTQSIPLGSSDTAAKGKKRLRTKNNDNSISKQLLRREITYSEALESFKRVKKLPDSDALNAALCAMQVLPPEDKTAIKYLEGIKGEAARQKARLYRGKIYRNLAKNAVDPMPHLAAALSEYDAVINCKTMSANDHLKAASARESILHQLDISTFDESVRKRLRHEA